MEQWQWGLGSVGGQDSEGSGGHKREFRQEDMAPKRRAQSDMGGDSSKQLGYCEWHCWEACWHW